MEVVHYTGKRVINRNEGHSVPSPPVTLSGSSSHDGQSFTPKPHDPFTLQYQNVRNLRPELEDLQRVTEHRAGGGDLDSLES